jgi:succinyl-CoA synthetase beta subunit
MIKLHGGEPANFLDVVVAPMRIRSPKRSASSWRPNVKAVLVNIFGGIMKCTTIAEAIVTAAKQVGFSVPLVVRLEGTEVEAGREILRNSDVAIISANDLTDAAHKVVAALSS